MKAHEEGWTQQTRVDQREGQSNPDCETLRKEIVMRVGRRIDENESYDSGN